jgi:CHAD domain-containing protein
MRKKEVWDLMRESMDFLKKNKEKWKERKLEESKRIKEEDKRDRLAIVKEKKKRYGIKVLSRDESKRLRMRTEERLEIAKAKENYWKDSGRSRKRTRRWMMMRDRHGGMSRWG